jgi:transcriptional regulator with XRE-family HTH domain
MTLGEHLRKCRLDLGQTQEQAASQFGVSFTSYNGWEADRFTPNIDKWPKVIQFLGYDPSSTPTDFQDAVTALQRRHGLTRELLATQLGIEKKTLFNWLEGKASPGPKTLGKVLASRLPGAELLRPFLPSLGVTLVWRVT